MNGATGSRPRKLTGRKVAFLATGGLLLVAVTAAALYFRYALPTGRGPAGPALGREAFATPWSARSILVVGLGDSVTAGFGARNGYGYFDRVVTNAPEDDAEVKGVALAAVLPNLQFTNLAVSGSTSAELIKGQLPQLPPADSNVLGIVLITTGGNDLIHNSNLEDPNERGYDAIRRLFLMKIAENAEAMK